MGRRKARERVFLCFPFPSPPAPAARVTRRRVGRVRIDPVFELSKSRITYSDPFNLIFQEKVETVQTLIAPLAPAKKDSFNN